MGDVKPDGTCLIGIDIDIEEAELIRCVERAIGEKVPCKQGKKGFTFIFRTNEQVKSHKINWVRNGQKPIPAIDVLCRGAQTVIPPSIHPDTKLPYRWVSGTPLWEIDYRSLPVFSLSVLDEIKGFCKNPEDAIYALNDMEWAGVGGGGNTHDTCLRAVSSMVGRNWSDEDIQQRIQRAKREACEAASMPYDWPQSTKVIQEWIDSSRAKNFDTTSKHGKGKGKSSFPIPPEMLERYVYVISVNRLYDRQKGVLLPYDTFNNIHARDLPKPWAMLMCDPDLLQVDRLTYAPGKPDVTMEQSFDTDAMLKCLNVWRGPDFNGQKTIDPEPWIQLVKDFCDNDPAAYEHMFKWFACSVQNPGELINHALILQGHQGIGKDSIMAAIYQVFGIQNCSEVSLANIESQFNEWLFGKRLIVFQEMLAAGRISIYNKLKPYITQPVLNINTKHISTQRMYNRAVYVFLTNYKYALALDPDDRRAWVWHSKMKSQPPAYYKRYYEWMNTPGAIAGLNAWLMAYDIADFNPKADPPMTDAKREVLESSASEVEQYLRQAIESCSWPMGCDLVSLPHLHGALRPFLRTSLSMLSSALDNLCPDGAIETRPRVGGVRLRLRAVRNEQKWKAATADKLKAAYRIPLPPQQGETEGSYSAYLGHDIDENEKGGVDGGPGF